MKTVEEPNEGITHGSATGIRSRFKSPLAGCGCLFVLLIVLVILIYTVGVLPPGAIDWGGTGP